MKVNKIGTISLWFINLWRNITCMYDSPPQIFLIIQLNLNYHFTHPCPQKSGLEKSWRREIKSVRFREGGSVFETFKSERNPVLSLYLQIQSFNPSVTGDGCVIGVVYLS